MAIEVEPKRLANIIALTYSVSIHSMDADTFRTVVGDLDILESVNLHQENPFRIIHFGCADRSHRR